MIRWWKRRPEVETIELEVHVTLPYITAESLFVPKGTCYHLNADFTECGQPTKTLLCMEHTPTERTNT